MRECHKNLDIMGSISDSMKEPRMLESLQATWHLAWKGLTPYAIDASTLGERDEDQDLRAWSQHGLGFKV